jgi:CopG family nickel-responsive transcriptional regulator
MDRLKRFGISIEPELLAAFDTLIAAKGYPSRSEALRDLIRDLLVRERWESGHDPVVGAITLIYDHHAWLLEEKLTDLQHTYCSLIDCATHVHLDERHCVQVIIVHGPADQVRALANALSVLKGVKHAQLALTGVAWEAPSPGPARPPDPHHSAHATAGEPCACAPTDSHPASAPPGAEAAEGPAHRASPAPPAEDQSTPPAGTEHPAASSGHDSAAPPTREHSSPSPAAQGPAALAPAPPPAAPGLPAAQDSASQPCADHPAGAPIANLLPRAPAARLSARAPEAACLTSPTADHPASGRGAQQPVRDLGALRQAPYQASGAP